MQHENTYISDHFSLQGQVAVTTGGTGVLGGEMARGLAKAGAKVAVMGRRLEKAERVADRIGLAGGEAMPLSADVLDKKQLEEARDAVLERWGNIHILVNAAGGNLPEATLGGQETFFDLTGEAFGRVVDLNLLGTLLPSQVFGEAMAIPRHGHESRGCIVNISSMAAQRPLSGVIGYSAAKAAVDNLTRWLAVELTRKYGGGMRVNAIAPGFFLGEQNRAMLVEDDGTPTRRGQTILEQTPAGRFGDPKDLVSTLLWLCDPGSGFVNGVVVPVDGGFSAFGGV